MIQISTSTNLKKEPYRDTTHLFARYLNREMFDLGILFFKDVGTVNRG